MNQFYRDVKEGLTDTPKHLSSKYFYDEKGSALFQQIMHCPEYYLTRCELEIFSTQTERLAQTIFKFCPDFDIVELGAGDAYKSAHLLKHLVATGVQFTYFPIDISPGIIKLLETRLPKDIPGICVQGLHGDYFDMIVKASVISKRPKVVLFLGSSIGNFTIEEATDFFRMLKQHLSPGDILLTGFDLKKDPEVILHAYDDAEGLTSEFNLNLLRCINNELGADFDVTNFKHHPVYEPDTGSCKSYLISTRRQAIHLSDTETIEFGEQEAIYMEISQKYTVEQTDAIARQCGYTPLVHMFDTRKWFLDAIWQVPFTH